MLEESEVELVHLDDLFLILNQLSIQLQGKGANMFSHLGIIKDFVEKLLLQIERVENNHVVHFSCVSV